MKNTSPSKFLENFKKQKRTPKKAANAEMEENSKNRYIIAVSKYRKK